MVVAMVVVVMVVVMVLVMMVLVVVMVVIVVEVMVVVNCDRCKNHLLATRPLLDSLCMFTAHWTDTELHNLEMRVATISPSL